MTVSGTTRTTLMGFIALAFAAIFSMSRAASAGDPDLQYETIRTEHFNIRYHDGLEHTARLMASISEEVFTDITILFHWQVKKHIELVLTDSTDSSNGSASVLGRPVIRLYVTAPFIDDTLAAYDHWLRTMFTHELVHIVHLSIHGKTSDVINSVFGDIYNPNQMLPKFIIEGIAVLVETHKTSVGRIRSSLYNMYVRTAALEDTLLNLGQVSNTTREYLRGHHSYIYGAMFMEYIYQKYGMEKIVEFCHVYGKSVLPYGINRAFLDIFDRDILSLYKEWVAETRREAEATKAALAEGGLTESIPLTFDGETKGRPIFDVDDRAVLLPMSNGQQEAGVFRVPLDGSADYEPLFLSGSDADLSMDRNGRIYYNRRAPFKNFYRYLDVFGVDRRALSPRRLTAGLRAKYLAVNPKGDRLAVVTNEAGTSDLKLLDENGNILKTLIKSSFEDQVYNPRWSPDGRQIAVVVRQGVMISLVLLDVKTGEMRFVTKDRFIDVSPTFDPTGRYLLFSSDRSGISNIYAFDFEKDELLQLTNVVTGAFFPAVSHNGKILAFIKYRSEGYDLHVMPLDWKKAKKAPPPTIAFEAPRELPPPNYELSKERYNPLPVMVPTHWRFHSQFDVDWNATLQAVVAFSDVTQRHALGTNVTFDTENKDVAGTVGYSYSGIGPSLHVGVSRSYSPRSEGYVYEGVPRDWTQVLTRGSVGLGFPIYGVDTNHSLSLTYSVVHARPREDLKITLDPMGERPDVPDSYFRAGLSVGWSYSDVVASPLGIGPHRGRSMSTSFSINHPTIGGTQTLATFRYRWTEYFPIPWPWFDHHTLTLSLSGGIHVSDPPNQWSFSVGGHTPQNIVDTILNNTAAGSATLRGYPSDAFRGSHFHSIRLNYKFPIWFAELGYGTLPVYVRRVDGSIFSDNAIIAYDELDRDDWKSSVGAQVNVRFSLGYYQYMTLTLGYAQGLMKVEVDEEMTRPHELIFLLSGSM